jgi:plastocyanin
MRVSLLLAVVVAAWSTVAGAGQPLTVRLSDAAGRPAAGVAVYLDDLPATGAVPPARIDQRGEAFVPALSIVAVGAELEFTNSDPTSHHVYSFSRPNAFSLPLYKGQEVLRTRVIAPGLVVLGCNIHDRMLGYVLVVDARLRSITDADGVGTFADVPPGRHTLRGWAPGFPRGEPPVLGVVTVGDEPAATDLRLDRELPRSVAPSRAVASDDY